MRVIDDVGMLYPELDLLSLRILLQIGSLPGHSIREVADILQTDYKNTALKIALMADGRGQNLPRSRRYHLITVDRSQADRRKRNLYLTPAGEFLAERLESLTEGGFQ